MRQVEARSRIHSIHGHVQDMMDATHLLLQKPGREEAKLTFEAKHSDRSHVVHMAGHEGRRMGVSNGLDSRGEF